MKRAIVVGSGAGGATVAKELQGKFQVTVLEAGNSFQPFTRNLNTVEKLKHTGLLFDEREIHLIFNNMIVRKADHGMVLVNGRGHGGTTTLSAGNAIRQDQDLKDIGINLDAEFDELYREIPVSFAHRENWRPLTREVYGICRDMGLQPEPTPKMINFDRCVGCGRCVLGCPNGAKWDSRIFLNQAVANGAEIVSGARVDRVIIEDGKVSGVIASNGMHSKFYPADLVILAAGGLGTPVILQRSGIECESDLFVDPVLCVATSLEKSLQNREMSMPFVIQREHYMISPYFDFLSFFFNRNWNYPAGDIFSLMIKLADTNAGNVTSRGTKKSLSQADRLNLEEAVALCKDILNKLGVKSGDIFLGTINAGHPGGMLPLTEKESETFHNDRMPCNLYVADSSLFPHSLGNPPILTIAAMAKRISKICAQTFGCEREIKIQLSERKFYRQCVSLHITAS
jgi:choline dehydrogenase-like flavoprotein